MFAPNSIARAAALATGVLLPGLAQAALPPAGNYYLLTTKTSFEPQFTDCWTFSTNGRLIYSPRLHYFDYQLTGLNTQANQVQALWQGRISIGFSATITGATITGNAVDASDRTYSFTGTQVSTCAGHPSVSVGQGYMTR